MKTLIAVIVALSLLPISGFCSHTSAPAFHPDSQAALSQQPSSQQQSNSNVAMTIGVSLILSAAIGYIWHKWGGSKAVRSEKTQNAYLETLKERV